MRKEQVEKIFNKIELGEKLEKSDAAVLLSINDLTPEYYRLLGYADRQSRKMYGGKGTIFAQIGLDSLPCPANCKFCSFSAELCDKAVCGKLSEREIIEITEKIKDKRFDDLFLMTTAAYDPEEFLEIGRKVRQIIGPEKRLVANTGDFTFEYAERLCEAGFTGVYHICRLGEGKDTDLLPEQRINTLKALRAAGLELYYCVEPIGPEHTDEQITEEIFRAIEYDVSVMAVMKRVAVKGTPLYERGEISAVRLAKICAVTALCAKAPRAMGVHEPDELCLVSGANQIYAEFNSNPRDTSRNTENSRGFSTEAAEKLLFNTNWSRASTPNSHTLNK